MSFDFAAARQTMVESQVRTNDVTDPLIQAAMRAAPRETLCGDAIHLAYADTEVSYAPGRWLMRPRDAGKLLQLVRPRPGERALAISAPYAALVLRAMGLNVDSADAADPLPHGTYDVVICEGAIPSAPPAWIAALASGGRLGVVERDGVVGKARVFLRTEEGVGARTGFECAAPLMAGFEPAATFAF